MENLEVPDYKADMCTAFAQGNLGRAIMLASSEHFNEIREEALHLVHRPIHLLPYVVHADGAGLLMRHCNNIRMVPRLCLNTGVAFPARILPAFFTQKSRSKKLRHY